MFNAMVQIMDCVLDSECWKDMVYLASDIVFFVREGGGDYGLPLSTHCTTEINNKERSLKAPNLDE